MGAARRLCTQPGAASHRTHWPGPVRNGAVFRKGLVPGPTLRPAGLGHTSWRMLVSTGQTLSDVSLQCAQARPRGFAVVGGPPVPLTVPSLAQHTPQQGPGQVAAI